MIKLNYKPTYFVSSLDLLDYADSEPIIYEVRARPPIEWNQGYWPWIDSDMKDVETGLKLISLAFVSVSQNGERWPLDTVEAAQDLRDSIEMNNPGGGDQFIKHLVIAHHNYHLRRGEDLLKNSETPSALSADGNGPAKSNGATKSSGK